MVSLDSLVDLVSLALLTLASKILVIASEFNINFREVSVFEPTHGSAPKYAELKPSIINPIATVLCACMMLDHLNLKPLADKIRAAVRKVVKDGKVRTYDMMKLKGGPEVIKQGAASSEQLTDAIIAAL